MQPHDSIETGALVATGKLALSLESKLIQTVKSKHDRLRWEICGLTGTRPFGAMLRCMTYWSPGRNDGRKAYLACESCSVWTSDRKHRFWSRATHE